MDRRLLGWLAVAVAGVGVLLACVAVLPRYLVGLDRVGTAASPDKVLEAKNAARTTLVQAFGGLFLLSGAFVTWRQFRSTHAAGQEELRLGRESRLTGASLVGARADLLTWWPDGFDPVAAGVRVDTGLAGADLRGADLREETWPADVDLRGALANSCTLWPPGFDWRRAGVRDTDAVSAPTS